MSGVCFVIVCLWDAEAQDGYSEGGSPHKSIVSDDADELYGDSIDEDTQSVKPPVDTAPAPSTSGERPDAPYEELLLCSAEPIRGDSLRLCTRGLAEPSLLFCISGHLESSKALSVGHPQNHHHTLACIAWVC